MMCTIISSLDIRKLRCREVMFLIWCHQAVELEPRFPETYPEVFLHTAHVFPERMYFLTVSTHI